MAGLWVPRTGAILVKRRRFWAFDFNPVFKTNLPLPIHIEKTIPLYCFLETTSKLITFSQRLIKFLVGILFEFFTPAKLTEFQRRIYLSCHTALKLLKLATLPEYSLFVVKSSSLIKKLGKFNGAETKVMNGRVF